MVKVIIELCKSYNGRSLRELRQELEYFIQFCAVKSKQEFIINTACLMNNVFNGSSLNSLYSCMCTMCTFYNHYPYIASYQHTLIITILVSYIFTIWYSLYSLQERLKYQEEIPVLDEHAPPANPLPIQEDESLPLGTSNVAPSANQGSPAQRPPVKPRKVSNMVKW